jgi:hypothetical protein
MMFLVMVSPPDTLYANFSYLMNTFSKLNKGFSNLKLNIISEVILCIGLIRME